MRLRKILLLVDILILICLSLFIIYKINTFGMYGFFEYIFLWFYSTAYVFITLLTNIIVDSIFYKSKFQQNNHRVLYLTLFFIISFLLLLIDIETIIGIRFLEILVGIFLWSPSPIALILSNLAMPKYKLKKSKYLI